MSASSDIQTHITALLGSSRAVMVNNAPTQVPYLRAPIQIVSRRVKELGREIEAAQANRGLCMYVMPPLPTRAMQNVPFVFFECAEIRLRIIERPATNRFGVDAYDLVDDVATALQWQPKRGIEEAVQLKMATDEVNAETALGLVQADPAYAPLFAIAAILAHPLQLAQRPTEMVEDPTTRIIDVIFEAVYQLNPAISE